MSNLINPQLLEGYVDDFMGQSVQGAYTGSLIAPQEVMLDRKLKEERQARAALTYEKESTLKSINDIIEKIVRYKKRGKDTEVIKRLRQEALEKRIKLDRLNKIKI